MSERMWSFLSLLAAGLAMGLAHRSPALWAFAWLAVILLVGGLRTRHLASVAGLAAAGAIAYWLGHPWQLGTLRHYILSNQYLVAALAIAFTTLVVVAKLGPVLLGWKLLGRFPAWTWLPAAILLGEDLLNRIFPMPYSAWLVTQATVAPVLRAVSLLGWTLAAWCCLAIATAAGEAVFRREPRRLLVPALGLVALVFLPPSPGVSRDRLAAVGAVHMTDPLRGPKAGVPGVRLLVWPEHVSKHRPWLTEGPGDGQRIAPPLRTVGTAHLYGMVTRQADSIQNSLVALDAEGGVKWVRAKALLFPFTEQKVFGIGFVEPIPLRPGREGALTEIGGMRLVSVLCLEGLERDYLRQQAQDGAELITVSASDNPLAGSPLGMRQIVAATSLVAADLGLPIVRSSIFGQAAIIDANGEVLAVSAPGTSGILTLRRPERQAEERSRDPRR